MGVRQKDLFLQGHVKTTYPSHAFRQHERRERHIHLEKKIGSGSAEMTDALAVSKAQNITR